MSIIKGAQVAEAVSAEITQKGGSSQIKGH